jgi:hypothetical protein
VATLIESAIPVEFLPTAEDDRGKEGSEESSEASEEGSEASEEGSEEEEVVLNGPRLIKCDM